MGFLPLKLYCLEPIKSFFYCPKKPHYLPRVLQHLELKGRAVQCNLIQQTLSTSWSLIRMFVLIGDEWNSWSRQLFHEYFECLSSHPSKSQVSSSWHSNNFFSFIIHPQPLWLVHCPVGWDGHPDRPAALCKNWPTPSQPCTPVIWAHVNLYKQV